MLIKQTEEMTPSERAAAQNSNNEYLKSLSYAPIGVIFPFASKNTPNGFLQCDGSLCDKNDYPELFEVIGYTFGGSGDKFHLPNIKGKTIVGVDENDLDFKEMGKTGGEKKHTLTISEMPEHAHMVQAFCNYGGGHLTVTGKFIIEKPEYVSWSALPRENINTGNLNDTLNAGNGVAHNNMQPYIVLNYIIKAKQISDIQMPTDQTFKPESPIAQSGSAVAEAIEQHNANGNSHPDIINEILAIKSTLSAKLTRKIVPQLPDVTDGKENIIYMVLNKEAKEKNIYDEYIFVDMTTRYSVLLNNPILYDALWGEPVTNIVLYNSVRTDVLDNSGNVVACLFKGYTETNEERTLLMQIPEVDDFSKVDFDNSLIDFYIGDDSTKFNAVVRLTDVPKHYEPIGSTSVDLSGYATEESVDEKIASAIGEINTVLASLVDIEEEQ